LFARKIIWRSDDAAENELRIIDRFRSRRHQHVVAIIGHGQLEPLNRIYIDMQLCDMNLDNYLYSNTGGNLLGITSPAPPQACTFPENMQNACTIISQISEGVGFLHQENLVHRDLKPSNGTSREIQRIHLSFILTGGKFVEDYGFWNHL
jgi:serine/threonine protein kinase